MLVMTSVWQPLSRGRVELADRSALAPMTRNRADLDGTPGDLATQCHGQATSPGLVNTGGSQLSEDGQRDVERRRIYTPEHVAGLARVADAVHERGGHLSVQLMHVGRISHLDNTPHHRQPVVPLAISAEQDMITAEGAKKTPVARELSTADIQDVIGEFRHAASSAIADGADEVETRAASGYLLHQLLVPNANQRADEYGGPIENHPRFVIEVARAVAEKVGADRTGVRISPAFPLGGLDDGDAEALRAQYRYLVSELAKPNLIYLHAHPLRDGCAGDGIAADIDEGLAHVAALSRFALANPNIVERLRTDAPLNNLHPLHRRCARVHRLPDANAGLPPRHGRGRRTRRPPRPPLLDHPSTTPSRSLIP